MSSEPRLSTFGLGYVGAVSAACFAKLGFHVIGVDIDESKVDFVNRGLPPVLEPGLEALLAEQHTAGRIRATRDVDDAVGASDVSIICVGTPSAANGSLDLTFVERVCAQIGEALGRKLRAGGGYHVVVVRSTVLPDTLTGRLIPILEQRSTRKAGADFGAAQNPEFLREGSAIADFFDPPRTVIGAIDERSAAAVAALYRCITAPLFLTTPGVASMVKYADNAFHAAKITFANEIGRLCRRAGIDSHEVMRIFCEDRKLNISPAYLRPGFAFGGSCLPKDVRALLHQARAHDLDLPLLAGLLPSNRAQIEALVAELMPFRREGIGVLGLSFKPGTDDLRESPLVTVVETLLGRGAVVRVFDPALRLDALVGSNRAYILGEIPHIGNLLTDSADAVVQRSRAIVVAHPLPAFRAALDRCRPEQVVFDLVRLPDAASIPARVVGWCW